MTANPELLRYNEADARMMFETRCGSTPSVWRSPCECGCWVMYCVGAYDGQGPIRLWALPCFVAEDTLVAGKVVVYGLSTASDLVDFAQKAGALGVLIVPDLVQELQHALPRVAQA